MQKMFLLMLLVSTAAPSFAGPDEDDDQGRPRTELRDIVRAQRSEVRPPRVERIEGPERAESSERVERLHRLERPERIVRMSEQRERRRSPGSGERQHRQVERASSVGDAGREWQPRRRGTDTPTLPDDNRPGRALTRQPRDGDVADRRFRGALDRRFGDRNGRVTAGRPYDGVWNEGVRDTLAVSTVPRAGTQPPLRAGRERPSWSTQWSRDWRDERRYDWRHHRDRNRSRFQLGFYYDPFGWNYQRYNVGWRMWPSYYGRSHWLNDPWTYRLPPAYPGTQWIRYHGDAILVDTWTGEVVDVIHDFFW